MEMERHRSNYEERVFNEREELVNKLHKLSAFLDSQPESFNDISKSNIELLREQLKSMQQYSDILLERIKLINEPESERKVDVRNT